MNRDSTNQNEQTYLLERMKLLLPIADLSSEVHRNLLEHAKMSNFARNNIDDLMRLLGFYA